MVLQMKQRGEGVGSVSNMDITQRRVKTNTFYIAYITCMFSIYSMYVYAALVRDLYYAILQ